MLRHIVIVGGGAAGWIAANLLQLRLAEATRRELPLGHEHPLRITLVASKRLGTIGVGESTTPLFTGLLRQLNIDEAAVIRNAGATYKLGVRFDDWRGLDDSYFNPFGGLNEVPAGDPPEFQHLAAWLIAEGRKIADGLLPHPLFMTSDKAPFLPDGQDLSGGRGAYAMHVDAGMLADMLASRAMERGVDYLDAEVLGVELEAETGFIQAVVLDDGSRVQGDFFIDCSGFRTLLIGEALRSPWESYKDYLPVDSALLIPKPAPFEAPVHPYTRAQAAPNGWIWEIPVAGRIGRGYVYQSEFIGSDQAASEAAEILGTEVEPEQCLRFQAGACEKPWNRNCVAVGLSAGFVEPLEATAIHAIIVQLYALTAVLTPRLDLRAPVAAPYNRQMQRFHRTVRDYLVLHYLGGRRDTPFWRQFDGDRLPASLAEKLAVWRARLPIEGDFEGHWKLFGALQWLFILQGIGHLDPERAGEELDDRGLRGKARIACERLAERHARIAATVVDHGRLLETLRGTV